MTTAEDEIINAAFEVSDTLRQASGAPAETVAIGFITPGKKQRNQSPLLWGM